MFAACQGAVPSPMATLNKLSNSKLTKRQRKHQEQREGKGISDNIMTAMSCFFSFPAILWEAVVSGFQLSCQQPKVVKHHCISVALGH